MSLRKVRDADDARQLLAEVAGAGVPRAAWARNHGVDPRSLNAWRMILGRAERRPPDRLRLVEWVATAPPPLVVRVCPFAVEVAPQFDEAVLKRLAAKATELAQGAALRAS